MFWRRLRTFLLVAGCCCLPALTGCQWWDQLRGPGFAGWEESQEFRPKSARGKSSGMFFDRRSEQIESNLRYDQ